MSWVTSPPTQLPCPPLREFEDRLRSRLPDLDERLGSQQRLGIALTPTPNGAAGTLWLAGAIDAERTLEGATCDDVVTGLALIAALRLGALPRRQTPEPSSNTTDQTNPAIPATTPSQQTVLGGALELHAGYATLPAPGGSVGVRLELQVQRTAPLLWALGVSYARGSSEPFSTNAGSAQLELCLPLRVGSPTVSTCAVARTGALRVDARTSSAGSSRPVWDASLSSGMSLHLAVALRPSLSLRAQAEGTVNLYRNEYFLAGVDEQGAPTGADVASFQPALFGFRSAIGFAYDF